MNRVQDPRYGKNGKNMLAQQMLLIVDSVDLNNPYFTSDKNARIVLEEYLNIVSKSVLAFIAPTEDELETYKADMLDSLSVIKQMAERTDNEFAKELLEKRLEQRVNEFEFFPTHRTIGEYCDFATAFCSATRASMNF